MEELKRPRHMLMTKKLKYFRLGLNLLSNLANKDHYQL